MTAFVRQFIICFSVTELTGMIVGGTTLFLVLILASVVPMSVRLSLFIIATGFFLTMVPTMAYALVMTILWTRCAPCLDSTCRAMFATCMVAGSVALATAAFGESVPHSLFPLALIVGEGVSTTAVLYVLLGVSLVSGCVSTAILRWMWQRRLNHCSRKSGRCV